MDVARVGWQQSQPATENRKEQPSTTDWGALFAAAVATAAAQQTAALAGDAAPPVPPRTPLTLDRPDLSPSPAEPAEDPAPARAPAAERDDPPPPRDKTSEPRQQAASGTAEVPAEEPARTHPEPARAAAPAEKTAHQESAGRATTSHTADATGKPTQPQAVSDTAAEAGQPRTQTQGAAGSIPGGKAAEQAAELARLVKDSGGDGTRITITQDKGATQPAAQAAPQAQAQGQGQAQAQTQAQTPQPAQAGAQAQPAAGEAVEAPPQQAANGQAQAEAEAAAARQQARAQAQGQGAGQPQTQPATADGDAAPIANGGKGAAATATEPTTANAGRTAATTTAATAQPAAVGGTAATSTTTTAGKGEPRAAGQGAATAGQNAAAAAARSAGLGGPPGGGAGASGGNGFADAGTGQNGQSAASSEGGSTLFSSTAGRSEGAGARSAFAALTRAAADGHARLRDLPDQMRQQLQTAGAMRKGSITLQVRPEKLGRVDVKLEFGADNHVRATVTADSAEALEVLKYDARGLERALQDAGLKTDDTSLSFQLRGEGQNHDHAGGDARGTPGRSGSDAAAQGTDEPQATPDADALAAARAAARGGVNVKV